MTETNLGRITFNLRGPWTATPDEPYLRLDVVYIGGNSYSAMKDNVVTSPELSPEDWQVLSLEPKYNLASPTTTTVGGLPANTDITGLLNSEILEKILVPYINPAFANFSMLNQSQVVESGTNISGLKTFSWAISTVANVLANSLEIFAGATAVASNLSFTSPHTFTIPEATLSGNGAAASYLAKARNTNNVVFQSPQFTITSFYKQFFGNVTDFPATTDDVRGLPESNFANNNSFTRLISSTKYTIAVPALKTLVSVITANNENITSGFTLATMNVNDAGGNLIEYKIYNFTSAIPLNINATIILQ